MRVHVPLLVSPCRVRVHMDDLQSMNRTSVDLAEKVKVAAMHLDFLPATK